MVTCFVFDRELVVFVLENALNVIMSQAVHNLRNPQLSTRDKQLVKRELSAELVSTPSSGHYFYFDNWQSPCVKKLMPVVV